MPEREKWPPMFPLPFSGQSPDGEDAPEPTDADRLDRIERMLETLLEQREASTGQDTPTEPESPAPAPASTPDPTTTPEPPRTIEDVRQMGRDRLEQRREEGRQRLEERREQGRERLEERREAGQERLAERRGHTTGEDAAGPEAKPEAKEEGGGSQGERGEADDFRDVLERIEAMIAQLPEQMIEAIKNG